MNINKLIMYSKIILVVLCISMSFSKLAQSSPIVVANDDAHSSPLLEFLKEMLADDSSPFTNSLVSKTLEDILKPFSFLSEFVDKAASDAEKKLIEEIETEAKKIEEELEEAIDKMIDDAIDEALKDNPEIEDDLGVEVDIDFSILDPLDLLNQISVGSFPQRLSFIAPIELRSDSLGDIEFSLINAVVLSDSRNVNTLRLNSSNIRIYQVSAPSTIVLFLVGFLAYFVPRINRQGNIS